VALALSANVLEAGQADVHDHGAESWITPAGTSTHQESKVDSLLAAAAPLAVAHGVEDLSFAGACGTEWGACETHRVPGHVPDGEGLPHHAPHVDHCGHAHVAALKQAPRTVEPQIALGAAPSEHVVPLRSIALRPALRPPIA
jgi:hypothetical protein